MSEDKKLNLRIGGKYINRKGEVIEIIGTPNLTIFKYICRRPSGSIYYVTEDGYYWSSKELDELDLVCEYVESAPELSEHGTHTLYLNVYRDGVKVHKFLEDAEAWAGPDRIRCEVIQVKY